MADTRTFIKVHDGISDHPKIDPLTDAAFRLLIDSWCWCSRHETDGRMPAKTWQKRAPRKVRTELLGAGLVVEGPEEVQFHDYLEHQQSAEQRQSGREQRRSAGRAGGLAKAKRKASEPLSDSSSEPLSKIQAEVEVEVEVEETPSVSARRRATPAPDLFPITPELSAWGRENAPLVKDPRSETARFLDHHRAKGSTFKDWLAAWRTWMRNAQKFALADTAPASAGNPATAWAREQG